MATLQFSSVKTSKQENYIYIYIYMGMKLSWSAEVKPTSAEAPAEAEADLLIAEGPLKLQDAESTYQ